MLTPITTEALVAAARTVGLPLQRVTEPARGNIYIWTGTRLRPDGYPVYIGKCEDARQRRILDELRWIKDFGHASLRNTRHSAIATTLTVHDAEARGHTWNPADLDLDALRTPWRPLSSPASTANSSWTVHWQRDQMLVRCGMLHT